MMRAMYVEFKDFMKESHGESWSTQLADTKAARAVERENRHNGGPLQRAELMLA